MVEGGPKSWETTNLLHLGQLLTHVVATLREETRGGSRPQRLPRPRRRHLARHTYAAARADGIGRHLLPPPTEPQDLS
jgi:L-aspartate oxidase